VVQQFAWSDQMTVHDLKRKMKYGIFIPRKVTRTPHVKGSVISDLFLVRSNQTWKTYFEVLNIPSLLNGNYSSDQRHNLVFIFFDSGGREIGRKSIQSPQVARESLLLDSHFFPQIEEASTFSLFHTDFSCETDLGDSFVAERGYTGFQRIDLPIKGYAHGNLDAVSYFGGSIQMLGNAGFLRRSYQIQHPATGPANYEFFIVNPSNRKVKIKFQQRDKSSSWKSFESFVLNPRGSRVVSVSLTLGQIKFIRVVSPLYLGRPVVFRNTAKSLDVFHG
jgi:hypothetical protein